MLEGKDMELLMSLNSAVVQATTREEVSLAIATQLDRAMSHDIFALRFLFVDTKELGLTLFIKSDKGVFESLVISPEIRAAMKVEDELSDLLDKPDILVGDAFKNAATRFRIHQIGATKFGIQSVMRMPLPVRSKVSAAILLASKKPNAFTPEQLALLQRLSPQLAITLDNVFAIEELRQREREAQLQLRIGNKLMLTTRREEMNKMLAAELSALMPCDLFNIWYIDPMFRRIDMMPVVRSSEDAFEIAPIQVSQLDYLKTEYDQMLSLFADAVEVGEDYERLAEKLTIYRRSRERFGLRAMLRVTIPVRAEVMIAITLMSQNPLAYDETHLRLIQQLAPQIGLALDNLFAFEKIERLCEQLAGERMELEEQLKLTAPGSLVGQSKAMQVVWQRIHKVAPTDTTVLIRGETGTGKELVARALHENSRRKERAFIKLNCAALPVHLIESELFGHEKGAFTGAVARRIGKFERANGGTIFLDEIGELPIDLQAKLLRVLQEKEIERVGGNEVLPIDARIIAATNRDLEEEIAKGAFRADLYYRLNTFSIFVPPLRERKEDIAPLAEHFVRHFARKNGKFIQLSDADLLQLMQSDWPGNVRELEHVLEQAVILSNGSALDLTATLKNQSSGFSSSSQTLASDALSGKTLQEVERLHIIETLKQTNGKIRGNGGAAERLGLKPTTLEARMKKLGIQKDIVVRQNMP